MFSPRKSRTVKRRRIIFGLKDDNCSREVLLRLLNLVAMPGDNVLAIHVQEPDGCDFDPNTFHIHEDVCKSKQVDFQLKVCTGNSFMIALSHQVRTSFATILVLGCSSSTHDDSKFFARLKALPPTCSLLVMDSAGRILVQMAGTSQEGSFTTDKVLKSSLSISSKSFNSDNSAGKAHLMQKSLSMPASSSKIQTGNSEKRKLQLSVTQKIFQRLATLDIIGSGRRFTSEQLRRATNDFSPEFFVGEGGHSIVYRAKLGDDQVVAVKVFTMQKSCEDDFFREVEILSRLKHENVVQLIGYCYNQDMQAVVCNLMKGSMKQRLNQLGWNERMIVAIHVAKALDYLHSCSPPIIHRDVKSSNILLSDNCQSQLSDFGAAILHNQTRKVSTHKKPVDIVHKKTVDIVHKKTVNVVGTFGYMAPEYMMYGRVDEKIDVYSYGVVLLELITGKAAIQTNQASQHESLVLWARSLLTPSLCERLIDPFLNENYDKDEMTMMMTAARLCLLDSSSSRPSMKTILHLLEEQEHWSEKQKKKEDLIDRISLHGEAESSKFDDSDSTETISITDEN